jgi:hypothetical protein
MRPIMLGDLVKDKVSGFKGIATSRTEFLNGCVRFGVNASKLDKDGKIFQTEVFDEEQLEVVKVSVYERPGFLIASSKDSKKTGGNQSVSLSRPSY